MSNIDYQAMFALTNRQEELLQFSSFSNGEAWKLGSFLVDEVKAQGIILAICIRKANGNILFQYGPEGTTLNNQLWMDRKFRTVSLFEHSSLGMYIEGKIKVRDLIDYGLNTTDYCLAGGGFPVKIKGGLLTAVITVSGLPHTDDHKFIIKALAKYLKVTDVPEVPDHI